MSLMNVDRARRVMEREGFDAGIASTLENLYYFSGVWDLGMELFPHDTQSYVVSPREKPDAGVVVVSMGEADLALQAYPTIQGVVTYGTFFREMPPAGATVGLEADETRVKAMTLDKAPKASPVDALVAAIEEAGVASGTLGVDERGANLALLDELRQRLPNAQFKPASTIFREIRAVKTPAEHERLIAILRATEHAVRTTLGEACEGVTERELNHVFELAMSEAGARTGFTLLRFGKGMALGQVPSNDTKLTKGDYFWM